MGYINIPRQTSVSVGASATDACNEPGTSTRIMYSLVNTSTGGQIISIAFGQDAVAGQGIVLSPGDAIIDSYSPGDPPYLPFQTRISAIASAAGGTLAVTERVS